MYIREHRVRACWHIVKVLSDAHKTPNEQTYTFILCNERASISVADGAFYILPFILIEEDGVAFLMLSEQSGFWQKYQVFGQSNNNIGPSGKEGNKIYFIEVQLSSMRAT
jgi:hypothetical protein